MKDIRIAVVQMCSVVGDTKGNLASIERYVREACARDVDILCFPELSISGYNAGDTSNPVPESLVGESTSQLAELGRETGLTFFAGILERSNSGTVYNTQVIFGPDGIQGCYRKSHVPTTEMETWAQGDDLPVFDHPKARYGIQICYDSHFPEVSTALAELGAEIIFMPHASGGETAAKKKERWLRYVPARAYDNTVYLAICNQVGDNKANNVFAGVSFICDPYGKVIADIQNAGKEEMIITDLSSEVFDESRRVPESFFRHFRRPEIYDQWMKGNSNR
ncbi:MAG: nitrilase [Lentisphaeria bacterium]|nr:nitrilase [Lentisphaeria bacterium]NQZ71049.1 nitrilase [Lentisphaeria bacterium]